MIRVPSVGDVGARLGHARHGGDGRTEKKGGSDQGSSKEGWEGTGG